MRDTEERGRLPRRQPDRARQVALADRLTRAPEGLALGRTPREPCAHALDDPRPLELGDWRGKLRAYPAQARQIVAKIIGPIHLSEHYAAFADGDRKSNRGRRTSKRAIFCGVQRSGLLDFWRV